MRGVAVCLALLLPGLAGAEGSLPAWHDVGGVAADDVLNVRQLPDAASPILGSLPSALAGIEVVALSDDGKWGRVNIGEASGWAAMAFLVRQDQSDWFAAQSGLQCSGTEPFWALHLDPVEKRITMSSADSRSLLMDISTLWPGESWRPLLGASFAGMGQNGMAVVRTEACSDGMSDMAFGLAVDLFMRRETGEEPLALRGCCTLAP
jgi:uncharacterized membrane protein